MAGVSRCRITVLKRTFNQDLVDAYLENGQDLGPCERHHEGQEFVVENPYTLPEGLCPWAWTSMCHDILTLAVGGDMAGAKQRGTAISGCTDWFRPVIFKVERIG